MKKSAPIFSHCNTRFSFLVFCSGLLLSLFAGIQIGVAWSPLVKMWDYRYGGISEEFIYVIQQTSDGGFILGGRSGSPIGGDKTQSPFGNGDYWIIKIDSWGTKQWDKTFGGSGTDRMMSIQQTNDGGYLLGGYSNSPANGNKSQNTFGAEDYWVIKTDSSGNKQWDKDFGGTGGDVLVSVIQTADGGFLLGGYSNSPISAYKTYANWDPSLTTADYWLVKISSTGIFLWDKVFGGNNSDLLASLHQTSDGSFVLGGSSLSPAGGNKSASSRGFEDYWVVKTDSLGNKLWDKAYGGSFHDYGSSINPTFDGGYILGGNSGSPVSGEKTKPLRGTMGMPDYWIVKIDSLGNKSWDSDFGGDDWETLLGNVVQTADSGYLLTGNSISQAGSDKSQNNFGFEQTWIVKTDSLGNFEWDRTLLTSPEPQHWPSFGIQSTDGCFVLAKSSYGGIGGDKSQLNRDSASIYSGDYWIIKFCDGWTIPPTADFISYTHTCEGSCLNFINYSDFALTYQWIFPGGVPDSSTQSWPTVCYNTPGIYDVTLIASNNAGSNTLFLPNYMTVFPAPPPQNIIQSGDTLIADTGFSYYQWFYNGNQVLGTTNNFYVADSSGDYSVVAIDSNGCESEAVINNVVAGVQSTYIDPLFLVYPNPAQDRIIIKQRPGLVNKTEAPVEITIFNALGEKVYNDDVCLRNDEDLWDVDCRHFPSGIYWLEMNSGKNIFYTRFLKQ